MQIIELNACKYKLPSESDRAKAKEQMVKMRKEGEKMVKGMFEFVDAGCGWFDFSYRFFPGEPIRTVKIIHGEIIDIPLILAKHLNNCYKKIRVPREHIDDKSKSDTVIKTSRTRFTPMDMLSAA